MNPTYLSGKVERWHTNPFVPAQTTADHSWGALALYYHLCPEPDPATIKLIVFHDSPELFGGDLAYPFKRANPTLAAAHEEVCEELAREAGIPAFLPGDRLWLEMLDRLESILYIRLKAPQLLQERSWQTLILRVLNIAAELNCQAPVKEMIHG